MDPIIIGIGIWLLLRSRSTPSQETQPGDGGKSGGGVFSRPGFELPSQVIVSGGGSSPVGGGSSPAGGGSSPAGGGSSPAGGGAFVGPIPTTPAVPPSVTVQTPLIPPMFETPQTPSTPAAPSTPSTPSSGAPQSPPGSWVPPIQPPPGEPPSTPKPRPVSGRYEFCGTRYTPIWPDRPCPEGTFEPPSIAGTPPPGTLVLTGPVPGASRWLGTNSCPSASGVKLWYMVAGSPDWKAICSSKATGMIPPLMGLPQE